MGVTVKNPDTAFASDQKAEESLCEVPLRMPLYEPGRVWCTSMMKRMTTAQNNELIPSTMHRALGHDVT
jgi:hypothetical protein